MKTKVIFLLAALCALLPVYSQGEKTAIQIADEDINISALKNVNINTDNDGKVYYNQQEAATINDLRRAEELAKNSYNNLLSSPLSDSWIKEGDWKAVKSNTGEQLVAHNLNSSFNFKSNIFSRKKHAMN